jgi:hypothetical protein
LPIVGFAPELFEQPRECAPEVVLGPDLQGVLPLLSSR